MIRVRDARYPLIDTLEKVFGGKVGKRQGNRAAPLKNIEFGVSPRHDIVSERLCDDVIKYLAPSLEQHKGCTLVDLHPGTCLWSSKLHDYLKPKRHLLLEPEPRYYEPFIKPLLDREGSTYRHTTLGAHPHRYWDTWKTIMEDPTLLPPREMPLLEDDERRPYDPSMLMIGNLARNYGAFRRVNSVNYSTMVLQQMVWSLLRGDMLYRDGRARMIMWAPESEAYLLFPQTESTRQSTNINLDIGASLTKIVGMKPPHESGTTHYQTRRGRVQLMEEIVEARVKRTMHEMGLQQPEGREFLSLLTPLIEPDATVEQDEVEPSVEEMFAGLSPSERRNARARKRRADAKAQKQAQLDAAAEAKASEANAAVAVLREDEHISHDASALAASESPINLEAKYVNPLIPTIRNAGELRTALEDARARLATLKDDMPGRSFGHKTEAKEKPLLESLHFPQSITVADAYGKVKSRTTLTALVLDLSLRIIKLEASLKMLEDEGNDEVQLDELRANILALDNECELWKATKANNYYSAAVDGQVAFFSSPPLVSVEARRCEALKAEPHEVWPLNNMMLLDVMPNDVDLAVPGLTNAAEGVKVCRMLTQTIMSHRAQSLGFALDRLAPNAAQDLIPMVPAITDPRKGGRLNPSNVRSRMVTAEMLEGLVKAWAEWPFKPSTLELELAEESSGSVDDAAEGADGSAEHERSDD